MTITSDLTTAPIPGLIRRLAIPAGTGFFFNTMFNVVDTWYGGQLSTTALAAMSLSFPVFFILLSVGTGASNAATALIGHALGKGDITESRRLICQSITFALLHALVLCGAGTAALPWLFSLLGAKGDYLSLAVSYMSVIFGGSLFFMLNFVSSAILSAHGDTASYRNFLIAGFFLNLALDPLFMYGGMGIPPLGLAGVALATVMIQCIGTIYLLGRIRNRQLLAGASLHSFMPESRHMKALFGQGFPAAMNMMSVALGIFIITWFVGRFGTAAVAAYGIGTRIEQIALLPVMGLNISTMALTAQNYGAGLIGRIRQVLYVSLKYGSVLALCGLTAVFVFGGHLMGLFTRDAAVISIGVAFLKIEALVFPAYVLLYICGSAMQGIKRPVPVLWVGLYRQIAAPVLAFQLLTTVLGWGIMGIWWGIFMVTWSAALFMGLFVNRLLLHLQKDSE